MPWSRTFLVCLVAACIASDAFGASRAARCRVACREVIDACITRAAERELSPDLSPRARKRAVKQLRKRCRSGLLAACRTSPAACVPTTTTTAPTTSTTAITATTTTTSTTVRSTTTQPPSTVTGSWRFEGEGTESCSGFETQEAVSFRVVQSGTALSGTWFPDDSGVGHGTITGRNAFRFSLDGSARHLLCTITSLVIDAGDLSHGTLSATAECPEGSCEGEWQGTLTRTVP